MLLSQLGPDPSTLSGLPQAHNSTAALRGQSVDGGPARGPHRLDFEQPEHAPGPAQAQTGLPAQRLESGQQSNALDTQEAVEARAVEFVFAESTGAGAHAPSGWQCPSLVSVLEFLESGAGSLGGPEFEGGITGQR